MLVGLSQDLKRVFCRLQHLKEMLRKGASGWEFMIPGKEVLLRDGGHLQNACQHALLKDLLRTKGSASLTGQEVLFPLIFVV